MRTGEGKTLVAVLPAYLNALAGKGVQVGLGVIPKICPLSNDASLQFILCSCLYFVLQLVVCSRSVTTFLSRVFHQKLLIPEKREPASEGLRRWLQVVTVNDYLARRDSEWVGQVHRFLGMEVGLIQADLDPSDRHKAYRADVTYVTNSEIGFGEVSLLAKSFCVPVVRVELPRLCNWK